MKQFFCLIFLIPVLAAAQVKKTPVKHTAKPVKTVVKKPVEIVRTEPVNIPVRPDGGYLIRGALSGLSEGTVIKMLNGSTGGEEQSTTVQNGKFYFAGTTVNPDFKLIGVNGQQPYLILFLDNSNVFITGSKDSVDKAFVKGSPSQDDFQEFSTVTKPYEDLMMGKGRFGVEFMDQAAVVLEKFINRHHNSFVGPLAIYRYNQITGDYNKLQQMYDSLSAPVKSSTIGNYLAAQIELDKKAAYGQPVTDFAQPDTSGKNISLSSFKGKYVLVDFWASWCGPCRAENPNVVNTFEKYRNKNFTVLSVSLDRDKDAWMKAIANDHLDWTHVSDLKLWNNAAAAQFGITSIPQNLLVDPQGNLVARNLRGAALEYKLSKVLK